MEIGGCDLFYQCNHARYILLINRICTFWHDHYITEVMEYTYESGLEKKYKEFFIHKNKENYEDVEKRGCESDNSDDFVHVLRSKGNVTVVVGSKNAPIADVIKSVFA